jgi:hypothetical protein
MTKLTLSDIADLRAYERERESFRTHVIALKKRRRVAVGPFVTVLFENRDTIRFQIQEMARVERILSDDGIQTELDIYNPLIPEPGTLCATLFVELTSEDELREWLPKLVGIERSVELRLGNGTVVHAAPEAQHDKQLTRETITASVHYLTFEATAEQVAAFEGGARLAIEHANYSYAVELPEATVAELSTDLRGA